MTYSIYGGYDHVWIDWSGIWYMNPGIGSVFCDCISRFITVSLYIIIFPILLPYIFSVTLCFIFVYDEFNILWVSALYGSDEHIINTNTNIRAVLPLRCTVILCVGVCSHCEHNPIYLICSVVFK